MPQTLLEIKNHIKSSRGLTRNREDGLITETLLEEAVGNALRRVANDCDLLPTTQEFPLVAGQWQYPVPEEVNSIISVTRKDSQGNFIPLDQISQTAFDAGRDPVDDLAVDPTQFAHPIHDGRRFEFYVKGPPNNDFSEVSRITSGSRRTVIDSGANFGRTWSGQRISPGDVVHNHTGLSYGYVEVLDMITALRSGGCDAGTDSTKIVLLGTGLDTIGVKVDDIIVAPQTGVPKTYAFITEIDGTTAYYEAIRGELSAFAVGTTVRVGTANKIRLSTDAPHRGLRTGSRNYFLLGDVTATLSSTVFSDTGCSCSGTSGVSVGQEAIAATGQHGYISAVAASSITVPYWIGGVPVNGTQVSIRAADEYSIMTEPRIQPYMYLRPTPSESDAVGEKRMRVHFESEPFIPTEDWQNVDVPIKFNDALLACTRWQTAVLAGTHKARELQSFKAEYIDEVGEKNSDIHEVQKSEIMTVWGNRYRHADQYGKANQGARSGIPYDISELLAANEE
ncbi:MAG: hypothetical protein ACW99G_01665 [Candidatus Thorarchaeota archaeon]|jgi:hypothetical protein